MARIVILFSWTPMPLYEHVYAYNLSYKLEFSRMAFASRPIMLLGLSATGSQWHLSCQNRPTEIYQAVPQVCPKLCPKLCPKWCPKWCPKCAPKCMIAMYRNNKSWGTLGAPCCNFVGDRFGRSFLRSPAARNSSGQSLGLPWENNAQMHRGLGQHSGLGQQGAWPHTLIPQH